MYTNNDPFGISSTALRAIQEKRDVAIGDEGQVSPHYWNNKARKVPPPVCHHECGCT